MQKSDLQLLFGYNRWANGKVLSACRKLDHQSLLAPVSVSFGSIIGTLVHIIGAEIVWRERLQNGNSAVRLPGLDAFPTLDALNERWQMEETAMRQFIDSLSDADMERWMEFKTTSGMPQGNTLWKALMHVINHGSQFRAEAGSVLGALGHSPGDLDLLMYLRETDQR